MAFCKFCGKEIADGAVCDCQESKAQAAPATEAPVNNNAQPAGGFDPVFGQPAEAAEAKTEAGSTDPIKGLVAAVVAILVVIFIAVFFVGHTGAKGMAKKYAKKSISKHGGKAVYSMTLSDKVYKQLKKDGDMADMIDDYNDGISDILEDAKFTLKSVKKTKKLSSKQLKGAEVAFASQNNSNIKDKDDRVDSDDFKAKKGYEFKLTYKIKDKDSGDKETIRRKVCVVKFKKYGWKVVEEDADTLKSKGEKASSKKDKDKDKNKDKEDDYDYDLDYDDLEDLFG